MIQVHDVTKHFGIHDTTLNTIAELNPDIQFYYLALGGDRKSIDMLRKKYPHVTILVSEIFDEECRVTSEKNEYWEFNPDLKQTVIDYVTNKKQELKVSEKFTLDLPLLFQHCRAPNTALSLYWKQKDGEWNALYRR